MRRVTETAVPRPYVPRLTWGVCRLLFTFSASRQALVLRSCADPVHEMGVSSLELAFGLPKPVTRTIGVEDVHTMGQAIQQRSRRPPRAQDLSPRLKRQTRRYHQAQTLTRPPDHFKEQFCPRLTDLSVILQGIDLSGALAGNRPNVQYRRVIRRHPHA